MFIMVFIIVHALGMYYTELMRSCLATVLKEYLQENFIQEKYKDKTSSMHLHRMKKLRLFPHSF